MCTFSPLFVVTFKYAACIDVKEPMIKFSKVYFVGELAFSLGSCFAWQPARDVPAS